MLNLLNDIFLPIEELERIKDLFSFYRILGFIAIGFINAILMIAISYKFFQALQQSGYNGSEYRKWLHRKSNAHRTRLTMLSMLSILGFLLVNMAVSFIDHVLVKYAGFLVYIVFLAIYFTGLKKKKEKLPLVLTKRMIRLFVSFALLTIIVSLILIFGVNLIAIPFKSNLLAQFRYAILCLSPILVPYLVLFAYELNRPIEKVINEKFVTKAKEKLKEHKNLIKIAITGSYGKTTVKNILNTILSQKYNVLITPESYNTPMGLVKTIKRLNENHEVFIAEMGAKRVGDIKYLSNIFEQNIAVVTGITSQHLETFFTLDNIIKTKGEIIENFSGDAFFSADSDYTYKMFKDAKCNKYLAGAKNKNESMVYAENVISNEAGTSFTLVYGNEKVEVSTKLLGKHNVENIVLASAVALKLNVSLQEIAIALSSLEQIPHRLQLTKNDKGVYIIDDGYNSNIEGFKNAVETLNGFNANKKIIVTPGIVELGLAGPGHNFKLGELLSTVCDIVILVGRGETLYIREGLISKGYDLDKIYMAKDLEDAKAKLSEVLASGDVVLFENDLPDLLS